MSPMPDFPSPTEDDEVGDKLEKKPDKEITDDSPQQVNVVEIMESNNVTPVSEEGDSCSSKSERLSVSRSFSRDTSVDALAAGTLGPLIAAKPSEWGAPLPIFHGGCLCLPYLSLPYMDLLSDPSVIGYFIGTSNILFQQKRNLADVLIDVDSMQMDIVDVDLRRQIQLTTEDLRFFDFILRHVQNPKVDAEGSDKWIRDQFRGYVLALLKTTVQCVAGSKEVETFNGGFVNQFKRTNCYVDWLEANPEFEQRFGHMAPGHPFAGTMSVQDVKLKLAK